MTMWQISSTSDHDLWVGKLDRPFTFRSPFGGSDFVLLLLAADPAIEDDEQNALSDEIVRQGCRYAVCTGYQCSKWDDSIDWAFIATAPSFSPTDERFVVTTWHENESLRDVVHFFRWNTTFDQFIPKNYLVLILGGDAGTVSQVHDAIRGLF